jgi:hypothetical protein
VWAADSLATPWGAELSAALAKSLLRQLGRKAAAEVHRALGRLLGRKASAPGTGRPETWRRHAGVR